MEAYLMRLDIKEAHKDRYEDGLDAVLAEAMVVVEQLIEKKVVLGSVEQTEQKGRGCSRQKRPRTSRPNTCTVQRQ